MTDETAEDIAFLGLILLSFLSGAAVWHALSPLIL